MSLGTARSLALLWIALWPLALGTARPQEAAGWLERLASGSAAERDRAQRWLGAHLTLDDYPEVARSAREADAETARRLIDVLGADDRFLGLVSLLLTDREPALKTIGESAFDELVARWCPGGTSLPTHRKTVAGILRDEMRFDLVLPAASEEVERTIDRLARLGGFGVPIVFAPGVGTARFDHGGLEGTPLEILGQIAERVGLAYSGIGQWSGERPGPGAWILVTNRGGALGKSGSFLLRGWVRAVARGGSKGAPAARALGASGWPAALSWLDERWRSRRDEIALGGILVAAGRGWVSRSLLRLSERRALIEAAELALTSQTETGRRFAETVARALSRAGAMTLGGEDRSIEWFEGGEQRTAGERWIRLAIAEGQRSSRQDVRRFLLERVEESGTDPIAVHFQALRALAALPRRPLRAVVPARLPELLEWARATGRVEELIILFGALRVAPPEGGTVARGFPALILAEWFLRLGDREPLVLLLAERGAAADPLLDSRAPVALSWSAHLRKWSGEYGPRRIEGLVRDALASTRDEDRERLLAIALLGGCLGSAEQREVYRSLAEEPSPDPLELELLGALAAGPDRAAAQDDLLRSLANLPDQLERREALARGLDRAVAGLISARRDREASELRKTVWAVVWGEDHPLHGRLAPPGWPSERPGVVLDLGELERELPASFR